MNSTKSKNKKVMCQLAFFWLSRDKRLQTTGGQEKPGHVLPCLSALAAAASLLSSLQTNLRCSGLSRGTLHLGSGNTHTQPLSLGLEEEISYTAHLSVALLSPLVIHIFHHLFHKIPPVLNSPYFKYCFLGWTLTDMLVLHG